MKYYAMINGECRGPYELDQLAEAGVRPSTFVWCKEMDDWEKAEDVADVCRMFRNRLYDLMHPSSVDALRGGNTSETEPEDEQAPPGFTRFDRQLQDTDSPTLPTIEEIEKRDDQKPPSPMLLPLAVLVTILCCIPTGIAAIYYAVKAKKQWDIEPGSHLAGTYCRSAKMWIGISFFLGMIFYAFLLRSVISH